MRMLSPAPLLERSRTRSRQGSPPLAILELGPESEVVVLCFYVRTGSSHIPAIGSAFHHEVGPPRDGGRAS